MSLTRLKHAARDQIKSMLLTEQSPSTLAVTGTVHTSTDQVTISGVSVSQAWMGTSLNVTGGTATAGVYPVRNVDITNNRITLDRAVGTSTQTITSGEIIGKPVPYIPACKCVLTPGPEPVINAGQTFIAVHGSRIRDVSGLGSWFLNERLGFDVTISWKRPQVPNDEGGDHLDSLAESLDTQSDYIIRCLCLAGGVTLLTAANVLVAANGESDGFDVGVKVTYSAETIVTRQSSWWGSKTEFSNKPIGWSRTLHFDNIARLRDSTDVDLNPLA